MKNLCLVLSMIVFAKCTFALNINELKALSWSELNAHEDVTFSGHQINFSGTFVSVLDICLEDEDTLRTITKRDIEEMDGDDFVVVDYNYLYQSINYTRVVVDGDSTIDLPAVHATTRTIGIYESDDDFEGDFLFNKEYSIPSCVL